MGIHLPTWVSHQTQNTWKPISKLPKNALVSRAIKIPLKGHSPSLFICRGSAVSCVWTAMPVVISQISSISGLCPGQTIRHWENWERCLFGDGSFSNTVFICILMWRANNCQIGSYYFHLHLLSIYYLGGGVRPFPEPSLLWCFVIQNRKWVDTSVV